MPTDEQREQFEAALRKRYPKMHDSLLERYWAEYSPPWIEEAWQGWQMRDAEVQALRERNDRMAHELFVLGVDIDAPYDEEGGAG